MQYRGGFSLLRLHCLFAAPTRNIFRLSNFAIRVHGCRLSALPILMLMQRRLIILFSI